jgi:hypothetical protein
MLQLLPRESFVAVRTYPLRKPKWLWFAGEPKLLQESLCARPLDSAEADLFDTSESRVVHAERYGGVGLVGNSGGVRCGFDGRLQVKGIGTSCLAGRETQFFHSYGGASFEEGVRDLLWGEVFNIALPHGAARIPGLALTGSNVPIHYPRPGRSSVTPRALILRDPLVRPAHFMRTMFSKPSEELLKSPSDRERTSASIKALPVIFQRLYGSSSGLFEGLTKMVERFAEQIAAARAKRLMHSALSPSNVSVDGRWVDFGMTSSLSDYGRIIIARGLHDFWHEEHMVRNTIVDLCFYIRKHSDHPEANACDDRELFEAFTCHFEQRQRMEFAKLTGVPEYLLEQVNRALLDEFYECAMRVIRPGNEEPFKLLVADPYYVPYMPSQMGRYHLNSVLAQLARDGLEACSTQLTELIDHEALRMRTSKAYAAILSAASQLYGGETRAIDFFRANCIRVNHPVESLYRTNLNPLLEEMPRTEQAVGDLVTRIVQDTNWFLKDAAPTDAIDLTGLVGRSAGATIERGLHIENQAADFATLALSCHRYGVGASSA